MFGGGTVDDDEAQKVAVEAYPSTLSDARINCELGAWVSMFTVPVVVN
jgi:hypothetical protein